VYQTCLDAVRGKITEHANHHIESRSTPAISNCSIRKAAQPWKKLAVPTEPFISFDSMP